MNDIEDDHVEANDAQDSVRALVQVEVIMGQEEDRTMQPAMASPLPSQWAGMGKHQTSERTGAQLLELRHLQGYNPAPLLQNQTPLLACLNRSESCEPRYCLDQPSRFG